MTKTLIKRKPIIKRIPIISSTDKYITVASNNKDYESYVIMGEYPHIQIAREHYQDDMAAMKNSGKIYQYYAIIKIPQEVK